MSVFQSWDSDISPHDRQVYTFGRRAFARRILWIVLALMVAGIVLFAVAYVPERRLALVQHPIVQRFMPTYQALRKLPDILYAPYFLFHHSQVPVYELALSPDDIAILNRSLPENPFGSESLNNLERTFVRGDFQYGDYIARVKVRYRGSLGRHWNGYQKSYRIEFPKENLFQGMREMDLVITSGRSYFADILTSYRAQKLGMVTRAETPARLRLNGNDMGLYIAMESLGQEWLEKRPLSPLSLLLGTRTEEGLSVDELVWSSWNSEAVVFPQVALLNALTYNADDATFKKYAPLVFNLDNIYAMSILNILAGSYHNAENNLVLVYNGTSGRFEFVPNHTALSAEPYGDPDDFFKRIFSITEFREERNRRLTAYIAENREDDLRYMETLVSVMLPELYADTAKADNNFAVARQIRTMQEAVRDNFDDPYRMQEVDWAEEVKMSGNDFMLPKEFAHLAEAVRSPLEFVRAHPQFRFVHGEILLGPGIVHLQDTVVVPQGVHLSIVPGTTLRMAEGVSLISYSPVSAIGSEAASIKMVGATTEPWGVFLVLNTEATSTVRYASFEGGSELNIAGVNVTGMLAFHHAPAIVEYSHFGKNFGDDAINVKESAGRIAHNIFEDTYADGIDSDYPLGAFAIEDNLFRSIGHGPEGGDGIDLSFSDIVIRDNTIAGCTDKGISVGERSRPEITNNIIAKCPIGIAVKDSSAPSAHGNVLIENKTALAMYRKKEFFGGGMGNAISDNYLFANATSVEADEYSMPPQDLGRNITEQELARLLTSAQLTQIAR